MAQSDHIERKVSAEDFYKAFADQWSEELSGRLDDILHAYEDNKRWTEYMLARKETPYGGSFLRRLVKRLSSRSAPSLAMGREWYTLDAVYYEAEEDSYIYRPKGGGPYPNCLHVIVEHENAEDVETEMWKLLMFRSPLKVLIFYDYRDDEKQNSEKKTRWLCEKLQKLCDMGRRSQQQCPEAANVEYLFLVGNRSEDGQPPCWRYCVVERGGFKRHGGDCLRQLC